MFEKLYEHSKTDKIAICDGESELSYFDLWRRSEAIAWYLRENYDRKRPVVIFGDKENDMIACMYGAVKAGKAYIAIPSFYPESRIRAILEDSEADLVLQPAKNPCEYTSLMQISSKDIDGLVDKYKDYENISRDGIDKQDTAIIMYTSGTTGKPKGVMISYGNLEQKIAYCIQRQTKMLPEGDFRAVNLASYGFSASIDFIYFSVAEAGAKLFAIPKSKLVRTDELLSYLIEVQPHFFFCTPTLASKLLKDDRFSHDTLSSIRYICLGGEALSKDIALKLRNRFSGVNIKNAYGLTEDTAEGCFFRIDSDLPLIEKDVIPVGMVDHYGIYLSDENGNEITDDDVIGEFVVYGECLCSGYYHQKELSDKLFVTRADGKRSYNTHDVGYKHNGFYYLCGRKDNQVKIGGNRIELEDVEYNMAKCEIVESCAVAVKRLNDVSSLVGFVVLTPEGKKLKRLDAFLSIKKEMKKFVESHMIPQKIVFIDEVPRNFNSKIDRTKLNEMAQGEEN